ncbi:hypothetical protein EZS27_025658, partial [termite gut metagenome]
YLQAKCHLLSRLQEPSQQHLPDLGPYSCYDNIPVPNIEDVTGEADNCEGTVMVEHVSDGVDPGCSGTVARTYRLTDECGNSADITQMIHINYNIALTPPPNVYAGTVSCPDDAIAPPAPDEIIDGCGRTVTPILVGPTFYPNPITCEGSIVWTYKYTACVGVVAYWTYTYLIDYSGGLTLPENTTSTVSCVELALEQPTAPPDIIDGCGRTVSPELFSTNAIPDPAECGGEVVWTFEYIACDGNTVAYWTHTYLIECVELNVRVYLEGPFVSGGSMTTDLNVNHLLPGQDKLLSPNFTVQLFATWTPFGQPYDAAPWNYSDNLGMQFGDASSPMATGSETPYPADVVDWVLVTVREGGILPANNIWRCAGWLMSNGDITFPEDCGCLTVLPSEDYYVMIEHRNHLGVLSDGPVTKINGTESLQWDFTTQDSYRPYVFRDGQKEVETGVWAMYAGNGNQDPGVAAINSADQTVWKTDQNGINYLFGDFNLNVVANSGDETVWKNNQNATSAIIFY